MPLVRSTFKTELNEFFAGKKIVSPEAHGESSGALFRPQFTLGSFGGRKRRLQGRGPTGPGGGGDAAIAARA